MGILLNIKNKSQGTRIYVRSNFGKSKKHLRMKMKEKFEPEIVLIIGHPVSFEAGVRLNAFSVQSANLGPRGGGGDACRGNRWTFPLPISFIH